MMKLRFPCLLLLCLVGHVLGEGVSAPPSQASNAQKGLKETQSKIRGESKALKDLEKKCCADSSAEGDRRYRLTLAYFPLDFEK